jgi:ferredoxin-NADP reductase
MAMIRTDTTKVPVRLIYSVRSPADILYGPELSERARVSPLTLTYLYTRVAPAGMPVGRINADILAAAGWPPDSKPAVFVCGPTGFVEAAANLLVAAGHDPAVVKTERFGPTG